MALEKIFDAYTKIQEILDGMKPTGPAGFAGQMVVDYARVRHAIAVGLGLIDQKQPYGTELFDALCRVTVTVAIEAVCLRLNSDHDVEVLLIQRRLNDTAYPAQWHCPGSAKRPGESNDDVFARLSRQEFWAEIRSKECIEDFDNLHEARGHFESKIFLCDVAPGSKGTWFPISALPEKTVDHHRYHVIPPAVRAFTNGERRAMLQRKIQALSQEASIPTKNPADLLEALAALMGELKDLCA